MGKAVIIAGWTASAITVPLGGSAAGTSASYLDNGYVGLVWRTTATSGSAVLDVDLGSARTVDVLALLNHNNAAASVTITAAASQAGLASPAFTQSGAALAAGSTLPNSGKYHAYIELSSAQTYRWWRFTFNTLSAAFEAMRLVIGQKFQPARNFSYGAGFGVRDLGGLEFSRAGVPLASAGAKMRTVGLSFPSATKDEAENTLLPLYETIGVRGFITLVTDPDTNANRMRRMYHGPLADAPGLTWRIADGFEHRVNLVSVI